MGSQKVGHDWATFTSLHFTYCSWAFPGGASGKEPGCQCRKPKDAAAVPGSGRSQRRAWQPTPVFLPGEPHGQRSLAAAVHGVAKSWTGLSQLSTPTHYCPRLSLNPWEATMRIRNEEKWKVCLLYYSEIYYTFEKERKKLFLKLLLFITLFIKFIHSFFGHTACGTQVP